MGKGQGQKGECDIKHVLMTIDSLLGGRIIEKRKKRSRRGGDLALREGYLRREGGGGRGSMR